MSVEDHHSLEDLTDRQHDIVLRIHETMQENIRFWRRILLDLTFFATTGMIGLTGFAVTRDKIPPETQLAMAVLLAMLGWSAALVCRLVMRHVNDHAKIVVRLDHLMRLFEEGAYFMGVPAYPKDWREYGTSRWADPTLTLCFSLLLVMPLLLSAIIVLVAR